MTAPARPRLALCIPAYNAAGHLPRLLESVRAQTRPFDEVLLYDDASTDNTAALARDFGATVVRTEHNTGPSIGKNVLAQTATADWVHFHDADDALYPEFVARTHALMDAQMDVVLFDTEDRDDTTHEVLYRRQWDDAALRADAIRYNIEHTVTNCGVYRREAFLGIGGFDTDASTKYNEDQAMHLRLAMSGFRFCAAGYAGIIIYRRSGSMSSGNAVECARAHYHVLEKVATQTGTQYVEPLGNELWRTAGVSGGFLDWAYARRCVDLALRLGWRDPVKESREFRWLARVHPMLAVRVREGLVRLLKPRLRDGVPTVR